MTIEKTVLEKISLDHPESKSADIIDGNIEQLKALFPDVFSEGKIDFEALKAQLVKNGGELLDDSDERYNFTWHGKNKARQIAQTPSTGTLRPCKEESVNWDSTENLFIEGDNLEVLKLLQKSYHKKVKMIYIDPPYNTGKDFVYKDNFHDNIKNYLEISGQLDSDGKKLSTNSESSGRYHSDWLNMMYPRLKLARNLLKDDGVIFISIDDHEVDNLSMICNEIFGEDNFIGKLPTIMNMKGNNDQFGFSGTHEYTLVFAKNILSLKYLNGIPLEPEDIKEYILKDEQGMFKKGATLMRTGEAGAREMRPKGYYPIYVAADKQSFSITKKSNTDIAVYPKMKDGKEMSWRRSANNLEQTKNEFIISYSDKGGFSFYKKQRLSDALRLGKKPKSLLYKPAYSSGNGTALVKGMFGGRYFDNPKPIDLIKDLILIGCDSNNIVLDFFAGSGTTAHAVIELNQEHRDNLKFILIQLPEKVESKSEAFRNGYRKVSDITLNRIKKAINSDTPNGVKFLKLDTTNIRPWEYDFDSPEQALLNANESIKDDRTSEDVLYEILLKYGLELTEKIEEKTIEGKKVFVVGSGALMVCLDDDITEAVVEGIAKLKQELDTEVTQVVFKDQGFADSVVKTNAIQILKQYDISDVKSI